jgi:hypothetical protein
MKQVAHIRWQYFLLAAGITGIVCVLALRSNSEQMSVRRDAVYAADRDNKDVQAALKELQLYVTSHMNTSLTTGNTAVYPPIQLKYTYERLLEQKAATLQTNNGDLYTRAQAYCQEQNSTDFSGRNRVPCIQKYVQDNGNGATIAAANDVPPSLYQFNFVSPRWSPDLAGWSLLATIILTLTAGVTAIIGRLRKRR